MEIVVLGIIQGLTEWFPVSSTGHLKVAEYFLGEHISLLFDFTLHLGTLIVTLLFFRKDIAGIFRALVHLDFTTEHGRLIPLIVVGTIPAGIIGVLLYEPVNLIFQDILPAAIGFLLCGVILFSVRYSHESTDTISYSAAAIIGIAEGIAVIPGVSRSGVTIAVALLLGIKRGKAFKFSFLLSIPAVIGALGYSSLQRFSDFAFLGLSWPEVVIGIATTTVVGYFALKLFWRIIDYKKFHLFALYCWLIGASLLLFSLYR